MLLVVQGVLLALAVLFIVATALPLVHLPYWWIRLFDFPRSQIAVGAGAVLVLYAVVAASDGAGLSATEWMILALLLGSALYQLGRIFPYTRFAKVEVLAASQQERRRRLRLIVSNVLMSNRDAARWARVVLAEEPDVIAAVEVDAWWTEQLRALGGAYPYRVEQPQDDTYGMAVYSRLPLKDVSVRRMVEPEVPSVWAEVALADGPPARLVVLHPRPPRPDVPQDSDVRDAELVLVAREMEGQEGPRVVAGDLNDVAWSDTTRLFQKLSGLLDPRRGRGLFATYHARYRLLRYPLDHVFHSADLTLVDLRVLPDVGGDHFPILVDLAYEPQREAVQEPPRADAADEALAEDLVEHAVQHLEQETPGEAEERKGKDR
jgi:endonuclease/exonuclease/phosphatase (EEP) superfamily protein YafD